MPNSKTQEFVAVLKGAERRTLSNSGNPRFKIHTDEGTFNTQSDAAISYDIENHTNARADSPDNWVGKRVRFTATMAGQITGWELTDQDEGIDNSDSDGPDARENDR